MSVVEELDWEEALARAREFFNKSAGPIFPTDLAAELATSVSQAVELCDALEEEGLVVSSDGQGKVVKGD